jgi:heat shock protein HtpX
VYSAIAANKRNTVFIMVIFFIIIGGLGWVASYMYGDISILFVVVIIAILYTVMQYFAAGSQALMFSGAIQIQREQNPRLWNTVENIAITTGMPMPKVYIINDAAPNAFATGRDPKHSSIAVTSGLLDIMDDSELEGVIAHEMGHIQNFDIRVSTIVFGLVVAVGIIADILLRMSFFGRGNRDNNNPVVAILGLVAIIVAPLVAMLVQLAVSRQREYLADATGALTTRHPEGLASALQKLGEYGAPVRRKSSSMSHMWIADPDKPGFTARLFSTHPPIAERIERLHDMGGKF